MMPVARIKERDVNVNANLESELMSLNCRLKEVKKALKILG